MSCTNTLSEIGRIQNLQFCSSCFTFITSSRSVGPLWEHKTYKHFQHDLHIFRGQTITKYQFVWFVRFNVAVKGHSNAAGSKMGHYLWKWRPAQNWIISEKHTYMHFKFGKHLNFVQFTGYSSSQLEIIAYVHKNVPDKMQCRNFQNKWMKKISYYISSRKSFQVRPDYSSGMKHGKLCWRQ